MNATAALDGNPSITLFTIGFTGKSAQEFFELLRRAGVRRLVDTRLNNVSQLAGFTKRRDLEYFLRTLAGIDYVHDVQLCRRRTFWTTIRKNASLGTSTSARSCNSWNRAGPTSDSALTISTTPACSAASRPPNIAIAAWSSNSCNRIGRI